MWGKIARIFLILVLGMALGFIWRSLQIDQSFTQDIGDLHELQEEITSKIRELELVLEGIKDERNRHLDNIYPGPYAVQF